jgi:hypothetical protein
MLIKKVNIPKVVYSHSSFLISTFTAPPGVCLPNYVVAEHKREKASQKFVKIYITSNLS